MLLNLKKKEINNFFKSHLFLSICGSILGVLSTAIFFILISKFLDQVFLAKFSLSILFFFSILQISLMGVDQNIIAHSKTLDSKKIIFDKKIKLLFISIAVSVCLYLIIFSLKNIFIINLYIHDFVILNISVILGLLCRVFQAYLQASSKLFQNAQANLCRYLGYLSFMIIWVFNLDLNILFYFLFGEIFALIFLLILIFFKIGYKYSIKIKEYNFKYLYLGISQFSYESLFKLDLLTIAIFGNQKLLILYSILSNIIEGIVNFLSVTHPMINNFMNRYKVSKISKKDLNLMNYINVFSIFIFLMILPSYFLLNYLIFMEFPRNDLIFIAILFSFLLIFFRKVFLFFFFFSINNLPEKQFLFSSSMAIGNFILNIFLFYYFGLFGIVFATLITYFISKLYISYFLQKYKKIINFI